MYELKKAFFDNSKPEELLLLVFNTKMKIDALGALAANAKLQYPCTVLCGNSLSQFDTLSDQVENITTAHLN